MTATIELYQGDGGDWRWQLTTDDGVVLADPGRGYASKDGARDAIERFRKHGADAESLAVTSATFEIYEDEGGDTRWRLRHANGNIVADGSQGYSNRAGVENGIASVKANAPNADTETVEE